MFAAHKRVPNSTATCHKVYLVELSKLVSPQMTLVDASVERKMREMTG
jgi:hypothetical protein